MADEIKLSQDGKSLVTTVEVTETVEKLKQSRVYIVDVLDRFNADLAAVDEKIAMAVTLGYVE